MTDCRLAIVVQRCHPSIAAGSEALAWEYARLLRGDYAVDVLTTTALDYVTWANELPAGVEEHEGITVRRFPVTLGRSTYWHHLHQRLVDDYQLFARQQDKLLGPCCGPWGLGLQDEFIRQQGPYSEPLLNYLDAHGGAYHRILFVTYIYPTTYFGLAQVDPSRCLLVPTLHDEPAAYLQAFRDMARSVRGVLWLSDAERQLGERLWGPLPGRVVALPVTTTLAAPAAPGYPYLLYCGRIDAHKGCGRLVEWFLAFKRQNPSALRLVLTGKDNLGLPDHPDIDFRGFVPAAEKFALMAGATAFVMPSALESFSIATLEAMAQRAPVLANAAGTAVADHVYRGAAGFVYEGESAFHDRLHSLLVDPALRTRLGEAGRRYVVAEYNTGLVRERLIGEVEGPPALAEAA